LLSFIQSIPFSAAQTGTHQELGWPNSAYATSKIGISALTRIQQKAFDNDSRKDIIVNSVNPGYVDTDMTSHKGTLTIEQGKAILFNNLCFIGVLIVFFC
jgi:carbonyl reductase 1